MPDDAANDETAVGNETAERERSTTPRGPINEPLPGLRRVIVIISLCLMWVVFNIVNYHVSRLRREDPRFVSVRQLLTVESVHLYPLIVIPCILLGSRLTPWLAVLMAVSGPAIPMMVGLTLALQGYAKWAGPDSPWESLFAVIWLSLRLWWPNFLFGFPIAYLSTGPTMRAYAGALRTRFTGHQNASPSG